MNAMFDALFETLYTLREDIIRHRHEDSLPREALVKEYLGLDHLARDILLAAIQNVWDVSSEKKNAASKHRTLPILVQIANESAPVVVSRPLLSRIESVYHVIRNATEHKGYQVVVQEALEYLEAVEALLYSIWEPILEDPPHNLLPGLDGYSVLGTYVLRRGHPERPWFVVHASRPLTFGFEHVVEFHSRTLAGWDLSYRVVLNEVYVATVQKVRTRSSVQEELLVWHRSGESMGVMGYSIFAVEDDRLIRLLERDGESGAYVIQQGMHLEEHAGDRVVRYEWDGSAYVAQRIVRQPPVELSVRDLHYRVVDGRVDGPSVVNLKVGEVFRVLRDDFDLVIVRLLYSANGVIDHREDYTFEALAEGEASIDLIPNVYDWANSLQIGVRVAKSD